ncbi:MAG: glycosyltransferase family 2 protein [Candidatus Jordarchaeum sp.]|uniref:glycosyltransferase family 2 protein n=1 Tax=Candidatus Jordarchaeum sp. TaxID=2823881 RepID=UPI004049F0AE
MNEYLISIILPTCGREIQFKNALQSILNQENDNWELIIVNDGEMDLKKYIPPFRNIVYIKNTYNLGAAASRNVGINVSNGNYIAYLDDDDEWLPNHLSISPEILKSYDFIYSRTRLKKDDGTLPWYGGRFSYKKLAERNFIPTPSVIHKRDLIKKVGYWNEDLKCLQDWDMWCRMLLKTDKIFYRDDITVLVGYSENSITSRSVNDRIRKKTIMYIKVKYYAKLLIRSAVRGNVL